jgi:lysophospholipase L1-like esterase
MTHAIRGFLSSRIIGVLTISLFCCASAFAGEGNEHWVGTWSTALHGPEPAPGLTSPGFNNQTLRQIVHVSAGGETVRVRLFTFGGGELIIGAAHIALRNTDAAIVPGSDRKLTFGGLPSITIPPGAPALSDPVDLNVPALSDLAISIFVPGTTGPLTWHFDARQTTYISPSAPATSGDFTASAVMPVDSTRRAWFWLAAVDVMASKQTGAIVAFGDSVTDGTRSTPDTNNRWPDHLARRLMAQPGNHKMGVLNQGMAGNRLLHDILGPSALSRFDRDVLTQTGVTHVIVLLGINDILQGEFDPASLVTADQIIQGHRMLIQRAHAAGLKIYGGTLTPLKGVGPDSIFPAVEGKRQAVNQWIRQSGEYDAVIDFDAAVRDRNDPARLAPGFDSTDHLHPNDAGYEAMADAIDLKLFKDGDGR